MKILFFIESLGSGGKERRMVELIKNLSLDQAFEMELVITKDEIHYKDIFKTGIKLHIIKRKSFKKDPRIFYKFFKIASSFKPDVIHAWGNLVAFYAIPTKIILRIPLINSQIADAPDYISNSFLGPRTTLKFSDKILANSYAGLKAYNAPLEKSEVIYNGFDFERIAQLEPTELVKEMLDVNTEKVVLMVASFSEKKDHFTYLQVAKNVLESHKDVTFLAVGGGDRSVYEPHIKGYEEHIKLIGKKTNIESIMNLANFGVLCTFTEGISNALLEFMSLKKPVLITGAGGCKELVSHGENGYLFEQGDVNSLTSKVEYLLNNQDVVDEFGNKSREIVEQKFNINQMIQNFKNVYNSFKQGLK